MQILIIDQFYHMLLKLPVLLNQAAAEKKMSEKYRNFINECLSTLSEQGRISLHSETLGKLTNLYKGLQEVISSLHVKQEHRQLFAFMTEKLSPVKYLYCYCTDVPELHKFTLSMFPSLCNIKINYS